ncbi:hypothetical protein AD006_11820 [Pseudonocardia sp. EC080610-09]|uniref:hypothetical protein n=1 Tax=unclassified Pseudonocardia TaxID=2619320 RepID=UPI0006CB5912|nr:MULTISPECIES: hypothetical protein [unclassified Pseudonocardia]ALE72504.1 hypothetical protein FRP1_04160 [Pseudonocardia sp. EC080625-04]ALL75817.1 hypothetical protein AD006_11820 [Pseudonocardia sp. EC080610-09]ALL82844.1 hypothetical protein AD017_19645 [Pseudonocardia sp. EC080619-01]
MSTAHDTAASVSATTADAIPAPRAATDAENTSATPPAVPATPTTALCRCGHEQDVHEHYRPGTDCGICGTSCRAFRAAADPGTTRRRRRRARRS